MDGESPRPASLLVIALVIIGAGGALGAATNAVSGAVSPAYFRTVLRWNEVENVWRAAIAQGIFEGLLYGAFFAVVFTLVAGVASRGRVTLLGVRRPMLLAVVIALIGWVLGGVLAMALAAFSPEFYRSTFHGVPAESGPMLRYAWVGGSIWGLLLGGILALCISGITAISICRARYRT